MGGEGKEDEERLKIEMSKVYTQDATGEGYSTIYAAHFPCAI